MFGPRLRIAILAGGIATAFLVLLTSGSFSVHTIRDDVKGAGWAAPVVFVAFSSFLTVCMFPGPLLAGASGLLFGTIAGTPISILSATLGACLAFGIARWWAHDAVEELAGPRVQGFRLWVGTRGFTAVLLARIAPGMPYSVVNYAAGLTPVPLGTFALATAIGCAPRAFAYTALGGNFGDFSKPVTLVAVGILVGMAIFGAWLLRRDLRAGEPAEG